MTKPSRNVVILSLSQVLSMTAITTVVFVGGITGAELTSNPTLATLPVAVMVIGVALFTIPASLLMNRFGRKRGFQFAALLASAASLLAAAAISLGSFSLFCLSFLFIGANSSFVQQYRFAASESVPSHQASQAVSFVLLGGVLGGFFGPEIVSLTQNRAGFPEYSLTFAALSLIFLCVAGLISFLIKTQPVIERNVAGDERSLSAILRQRGYQVAVLAGVVAYGVMSLLMTATPISMHTLHGFSLDATGWVIRSHVIAMFLPSLFSGWLISRLGVTQVMGLGTLAMALTVILDVSGAHFLNYWSALVLLGVGWNFLFVGGTVMLTHYYFPSERFKAQALNDFTIFGIQALASLSAGSLIYLTSWSFMNLIVLPALMLMLVSLVVISRHPSQASASVSS